MINKFKIRKYFQLFFILVAVSTCGACLKIQKGEKIGVLTKFAKQGIFCPTWEGQIVRGGFNQGSGVNGSSFDFSVDSDELAHKLQEALGKQEEIKITYHKEFMTFCRSESNNYFVTGFEILNKK